ncbi:cytochrome c oxidase cbb3-type subunit IV [Phycisphaerales bacterium]|nr:cytochrome c oxidase cbb3-type subunit IV [Phycisphaerales bacterium]
MSLSELMSGMKLAAFPTIALVIFLVVFAVVTFRVLFNRDREEYERAARMPLEDSTNIDGRHGGQQP